MSSRNVSRRRGGEFRAIDEIAVAAGALISRRGHGRHLQAMAAWRSAVGDRVQRVTRVTRVDGDTWTVDVPDGAWSTTLHRLERPILESCRERLGDDAPRRLEFRVASGFWRPEERPTPSRLPRPPVVGRAVGAPAPAAGPTPPASPPPLSPQEVPVPDPELRARLQRIGALYLARRRD